MAGSGTAIAAKSLLWSITAHAVLAVVSRPQEPRKSFVARMPRLVRLPVWSKTAEPPTEPLLPSIALTQSPLSSQPRKRSAGAMLPRVEGS